MVKVTRFDGTEFYINAELVEMIEMTPDTMLSLTSHRKVVVRESAEAVVDQIVAYHRRIHSAPTVVDLTRLDEVQS